MKKRTVAKIAEIFFASGIPVTGLAVSAEDGAAFISSLPLLLAVIAAGGWHVKTLNDDCEDGFSPARISRGAILPLVALPFMLYFNPLMAAPLVLIFLNWDFYSLFGKNHFPLSMGSNLLAGFLHFSLGLAAGGRPLSDAMGTPEAFFFALAMLSGSMHHDAYHQDEDFSRGATTGAVRFGPELWWKAAVFPMILSIPFLAGSSPPFLRIFSILALTPYFIGYFSVLTLAEKPQKEFLFRLFCRLSFGISASLYIVLK